MKSTRTRAILLALTVILLEKPFQSLGTPIFLEVPGYAKLVMGSSEVLDNAWESRRPFFSFRSLKYAASPEGENRFLPPKPSNYPYPDDEIYNANELELGCPQSDFWNENCLVITVYTPYLPGNASDPRTTYDKNLPVMYWIHGGGFTEGQNIIYEPHTFMDYDIVIVQVQYRLGALGFLSLGTDEIPGNAGLFDQIEGLRWTQKFIKYFGGDPNKVTIMGESAGGASVGLLLLAPQTRGLFHGAIAESGSALTDWAIDRDQIKTGWKIAEYAECPLDPYEATLACLRTIDQKKLRDAQRRYSREDENNGGLGYLGQNPVIQVAGAERVLVREPKAILEDGDYNTQVKIMFGSNKHDGIYVADSIYRHFIRPNNLTYDVDFLKYGLVSQLLWAMGVPDDSGSLSDALYEKYFSYAVEAGMETDLAFLMPGIVDLGGAIFLRAGGFETVRLQARHNPGSAYAFSFDYRGRFQLLGSDPIVPPGAGHADELSYLWTIPFPHNTSESNMRLRMLKTWTNFIIHGDPTPEGEPLLNGIPKFLPFDSKDKWFMAINEKWELRRDPTNYYTVSVDDLYPERKPTSKKSKKTKRRLPGQWSRQETLNYLQKKRNTNL